MLPDYPRSLLLIIPKSSGGGLTWCKRAAAGIMACWNHPFEVARIEAQARGDQNQKDLNMIQIFRMIVKEQVIPPWLCVRPVICC